MSLSITLNQVTLEALAAEAAARNTTREQVVCDVLENHFTPMASPDSEYDAWFRAKVEEGKNAARRGDICSHADVQQDIAERRAKWLARATEK